MRPRISIRGFVRPSIGWSVVIELRMMKMHRILEISQIIASFHKVDAILHHSWQAKPHVDASLYPQGTCLYSCVLFSPLCFTLQSLIHFCILYCRSHSPFPVLPFFYTSLLNFILLSSLSRTFLLFSFNWYHSLAPFVSRAWITPPLVP